MIDTNSQTLFYTMYKALTLTVTAYMLQQMYSFYQSGRDQFEI